MTLRKGGDARHLEGAAASAGPREAIARLLDETREIAIARYEEPEGPPLAELAGACRAAVEAAMGIVGSLLERFDDAPTSVRDRPPASRSLAPEQRADAPSSREQIAGLSFVAERSLRARLRDLEALGPAGSRWKIIEVAGEAVRDVVQSMSVLDVALADLDGQQIENQFYVTELEGSLRVRRAYAIFHADISATDDRPGLDAAARLRIGGTAIAKLTGRAEYPMMRIVDRQGLRQFQRKIRAYLCQGPGERESSAGGERLWRDLVGFTEMLMLVNQRAELVEHDRQQTALALEAIENGASPSSIAATIAPMLGRCSQVDALLRQQPPPAREQWREALRRCDRLGTRRERAD